jgi:hypothetical protein
MPRPRTRRQKASMIAEFILQSQATNRQSPVDRAVQRYTNSLRKGFNPSRVDGDTESQAANYREALEHASIRAGRIKQVLCELGVLPLQFMSYRSFGLRVDKLVRTCDGHGLRVRVVEAIQRWQWHGCDRRVLEAVCERVFGIDLESLWPRP